MIWFGLNIGYDILICWTITIHSTDALVIEVGMSIREHLLAMGCAASHGTFQLLIIFLSNTQTKNKAKQNINRKKHNKNNNKKWKKMYASEGWRKVYQNGKSRKSHKINTSHNLFCRSLTEPWTKFLYKNLPRSRYGGDTHTKDLCRR